MANQGDTNSSDIEAERAAYRARRTERLKDRPRLPPLTLAEFRALFEGAEPATDDDVPWTFPVRTPVREDSTS